MRPGQPALSPALISTCRTHAGIVFMILTLVTGSAYALAPCSVPTDQGRVSFSLFPAQECLSLWLFMTEGVYVSTVTSTVTLTLPQNCCVPDTM